MEIRKKTEHMGVLVIRPVSKDVARELIIKGHYSHKWLATFGIHNFGIFREGAEADEDCLGVARPLKPGAPKETQEAFLTDLLGDLDAVRRFRLSVARFTSVICGRQMAAPRMIWLRLWWLS